ncbi:MAG: hypothetical protein K6348_02215, partial [Deferribacterales bacterium]
MKHVLLLSDNIDEIKRCYQVCNKNRYNFYYFNEEKKCVDFLINEKIDVAIINLKYVLDAGTFIQGLRDK